MFLKLIVSMENREIIDLIGKLGTRLSVFLSLSINHSSLYYVGLLKDSFFTFYAKRSAPGHVLPDRTFTR